jgi:hypothetical protein
MRRADRAILAGTWTRWVRRVEVPLLLGRRRRQESSGAHTLAFRTTPSMSHSPGATAVTRVRDSNLLPWRTPAREAKKSSNRPAHSCTACSVLTEKTTRHTTTGLPLVPGTVTRLDVERLPPSLTPSGRSPSRSRTGPATNGVPTARNTRGCGHVRPQCGRTPLDGVTQGVTVELFACALIRQNSTGRHDPEPAVTNPRGLVMRRSHYLTFTDCTQHPETASRAPRRSWSRPVAHRRQRRSPGSFRGLSRLSRGVSGDFPPRKQGRP